MHCAIFKTRWGWFGLLADDHGLRRACLPLPDKDTVQAYLLAGLADTPRLVRTLGDAQDQVNAYFDGRPAEFIHLPVSLSGLSPFQQTVLTALRSVPVGQTITYTDLARRSRRPRAVRAVASAVAQNPLPLIIPCHRVLRKDGSLGGFSAPGGTLTKKRLLTHEKTPTLSA